MKRLLSIAVVAGIALALAACSGGSGTDNPDNVGGPLKLIFAAASPGVGASPLRVTLTANISGGEAPYFYAWDFTNDGSFDDYRNDIFLKTLSVQHDYYLLGGGVADTAYEAVLRVTDSKNNSVTSDPVAITVSAEGGLLVTGVTLFSNEQDANGNFILASGKSVFFRPDITGGAQPYTYQWDFNADGAIDSTLANPEYTFTYPGTGSKVFVVKLKLIDNNGQVVIRDILVAVEGSANVPGGGGGGADPGFSIVLNSSPPADGSGNIILNWDASANNPDLPLEPSLDLAVVVDATQGGRPPFEYYWDFEDDGAFDSQVLSPTVPYYDTQRKILVNPYLHQERTKTYKLRVFVIDSLGNMEQATRNIISNNQENAVGKLQVTGTYGVATASGTFASTPPLPYNQVSGPLAQTDVRFQVAAAGGTGTYDWQIDIDGDNVADWPALADEPTGFSMLAAGSANYVAKFGFYDDGGVQVSDWPALGYYAASATVRSLNPSTLVPVETFKVQMPVSLVRRDDVAVGAGPGLINRNDMVMVGQADPAIAGANANYVPSRRIVIAGGYTGTTPLGDVQEIVQVFDEPSAAETLELLLSTTSAGRIPLNQPRGGASGVTDGADIFLIGGKNTVNGILGTCETAAFATNSAWGIAGELRTPEYFPLTKAAGAFLPVAVGGVGPGYLFAGGIHPPGGSDVDDVSGRLLFTDLTDQNPNVNGIQLGFGSSINDMVTERYDACAAFTNNRLYMIGGRVANGRSVSTVEAFNMLTGQWENVPSLKDFRSGANCEVIDGVIYVHGGAFYPGNDLPGGGSGSGNRSIVTSSECFNPLTGVWSYTVGLPTSTENGATCAIAGAGSADALPAQINQVMYFGGTNTAAADTNSLYEFTYFYTITPTP